MQHDRKKHRIRRRVWKKRNPYEKKAKRALFGMVGAIACTSLLNNVITQDKTAFTQDNTPSPPSSPPSSHPLRPDNIDFRAHWGNIYDNCLQLLALTGGEKYIANTELPSEFKRNFTPNAQIIGKIVHEKYTAARQETGELKRVNTELNDRKYQILMNIADEIRNLNSGDTYIIFLHSGGGSLDTAQIIVDAINQAKENNAIVAVYTTSAHSAASLILSAASEGYRVIEGHANTIIHAARITDKGDSTSTDDDSVCYEHNCATQSQKETLINANIRLRQHYIDHSSPKISPSCARAFVRGMANTNTPGYTMLKSGLGDIHFNGGKVTLRLNDLTQNKYPALNLFFKQKNSDIASVQPTQSPHP